MGGEGDIPWRADITAVYDNFLISLMKITIEAIMRLMLRPPRPRLQLLPPLLRPLHRHHLQNPLYLKEIEK